MRSRDPVVVPDLATLQARFAALFRAGTPFVLASGAQVIVRDDGAWFAVLVRSEESAGCHGVGGYHTTTTVAQVFDGRGLPHAEVVRAFTETVSESQGDSESGETIEAMRFDGDTLVLTLSSGPPVLLRLPPAPGGAP